MSDSLFEVNVKPGEEVTIRMRPGRLPEALQGSATHFRAANREVLLAFRDLLDGLISSLDENTPRPQRRAKSRIDIQ